MDSLRSAYISMADQQDIDIERFSGHLAQTAAGAYGDFLIASGDPATGYAFKLGASGLEVAVQQTAGELSRRWNFIKRAYSAKRKAKVVQDPTSTEDLIQGTSKLIGTVDSASVRELMTAVVEGTISSGGDEVACAQTADWLDTLHKFKPVDGIVFGEVCRIYRDAEHKSTSVIIGVDGVLKGFTRDALLRSLVRLNQLKLLGSEKLPDNQWGLNLDVLGVEICEGIALGQLLADWEASDRGLEV
jgi:hypothetical protein